MHIEQPDAPRRLFVAPHLLNHHFADAAAGIGDGNANALLLGFDGNHHHALTAAGLNTVYDGVLHQWMNE